MKKLLFFSLFCLQLAIAFSQAPLQLNYKAVVRDNTGNPVANSTPVALTFNILSGSTTGSSVYTETISTTANQFGLVIAQIGSTADLSTINWSTNDTLYLKISASISGGAVVDMGTTQLVSVPYALYAGNNWGLTGNGNVTSGDFVGSTNGSALNFKVNNVLSGHIDSTTPGNTYIGYAAFSNNTSGGYNTAFGSTAMHTNNSGGFNTATGWGALYGNTQGSNNTATGYQALGENLSGANNTATGSQALHINIGSQNTATGQLALFTNTFGNTNTATGCQALYNNSNGSGNTADGFGALYFNKTGNGNVALGEGAINGNTTGSSNTAVGLSALFNNSTGSENTALGFQADITTNGISNSAAIGYNAKVAFSNTMQFGNDTVTQWLFGAATGSASGVALRVGHNNTDGNEAFLTSGGVWTNVSAREKKDDFTPLNKSEILSKIESMDIAKWRYKGSNEYHIGPVAEDFYEAFHVGINNKSVSTIDPAGIALVAVQALNEKIEQLEKEIQALKAQNTSH